MISSEGTTSFSYDKFLCANKIKYLVSADYLGFTHTHTHVYI